MFYCDLAFCSFILLKKIYILVSCTFCYDIQVSVSGTVWGGYTEVTAVILLPQEVRLLGLAEVAHSHVRQHLLLQHLLGVLDPPLLGDARLGASGADEVERHVLLLNDEGLVQGGLHLKDTVGITTSGLRPRFRTPHINGLFKNFPGQIPSNSKTQHGIV